jgi:hypothetical protein
MKIKTSFEEEHSPKYYGVQKIKDFQTFSLDLDKFISVKLTLHEARCGLVNVFARVAYILI